MLYEINRQTLVVILPSTKMKQYYAFTEKKKKGVSLTTLETTGDTEVFNTLNQWIKCTALIITFSWLMHLWNLVANISYVVFVTYVTRYTEPTVFQN